MHRIAHFAAWTLNNPWTLGPMCIALVFVPILGMWAFTNTGGNIGHRLTDHISNGILFDIGA